MLAGYLEALGWLVLPRTRRTRTWKDMANWQRKQWYRENERRRILGQHPLRKPGVKRQ